MILLSVFLIPCQVQLWDDSFALQQPSSIMHQVDNHRLVVYSSNDIIIKSGYRYLLIAGFVRHVTASGSKKRSERLMLRSLQLDFVLRYGFFWHSVAYESLNYMHDFDC